MLSSAQSLCSVALPSAMPTFQRTSASTSELALISAKSSSRARTDWGRRERRSAAAATCRPPRHLRLWQGGEGGSEEALLHFRAEGRAEGKEHRRARRSLPH